MNERLVKIEKLLQKYRDLELQLDEADSQVVFKLERKLIRIHQKLRKQMATHLNETHNYTPGAFIFPELLEPKE